MTTFSDTYNTFDKIKVLGHHIMEVIGDEYSAHIELRGTKTELPSGHHTLKFLT